MAQTNVAKSDEGGYSKWDISPFIGWQWYQLGEHSALRPLDFNSGPAFGARLTEDVSKYVGIEEGLTIGLNNLRFLPAGYPSNAGRVGLKSQNYSLDAALVFNLTPRGSSWRPFVVVGPDATWYRPAKAPFTNVLNAEIPPNQPKTKLEPGIMFGVGINISPSAILDINYRYLNTGATNSITNPNTGATSRQTNSSQQVRVGIRYMVN